MEKRTYTKKNEKDVVLQNDILYKELLEAEQNMILGMINSLSMMEYKRLYENIDLAKAYKLNLAHSLHIMRILVDNKEYLIRTKENENLLFMLKELGNIKGLDVNKLYIDAFDTIEFQGVYGVHLKHYTELFIELSKKFELRTKAYAMIDVCNNQSTKSFDVVESMKQVASDYEVTKELSNIGDIAEEIKQEIESGVVIDLVSTGYKDLDFKLEGFMSQEIIVLAGRPGTGKTALALNLALNVAKQNKTVLFVSLEMSDKSLVARAIANLGSIDASFYRKRDVFRQNDFDFAVDTLKNLPITILEKCGRVTVSKVKEKAMKQERLGLIVIDYLQLMKTDERYGNREQEVSSISRELKLMALELNVPVLALAQLNRQVEQTGQEPKASDLRESGAIEQDADIILMLHAKKDSIEKDIVPVKCKIVKSRSTGIGTCFFDFKKSHSRFAQGSIWQETQTKGTTF